MFTISTISVGHHPLYHSLKLKMERRRFVGPEGSVKPLKLSTLDPNNLLNTETLTRAVDGRFPEQMRSFNVRPNVISQAKGSCYLEIGNTKLTCAIYGPRGTGKIGKAFLDQGNVYCEVDLLPFASDKRRPFQREPEEQELSRQLQEALETVIRRESFPNSVVDVYVNVIEDDGSVLAASITAASLALSLAGIQLLDTLVATTTISTPTCALIDPTRFEQDSAQSQMTVAVMANSGEIAQIALVGPCEDVLMREAMALAVEGCSAIYEQIKPILLA